MPCFYTGFVASFVKSAVISAAPDQNIRLSVHLSATLLESVAAFITAKDKNNCAAAVAFGMLCADALVAGTHVLLLTLSPV